MERQRRSSNVVLIGICLLVALILIGRGGGRLLLILLGVSAIFYVIVIGIRLSRRDRHSSSSPSSEQAAAKTDNAPNILIPVMRRSAKDRHIRQTDRAILALAVQNGGYLTAADVTLRTDQSLDEATASLERIRQNGHATLRIANNGTYVYHFGGILTEEEKRQAERV